MFIELTEYLQCLGDHAPTYLVVTPDTMSDRAIVAGQIGCPRCHREYEIRDRVAWFGASQTNAAPSSGSLPATADTLHALLGLTGPGGYVVLLDAACALAGALAERLEGVHFVGVNAPAEVEPGPHLSLLRCDSAIPLRDSMARGVVGGRSATTDPWGREAVRVLLRGRRLVAFGDGVASDAVTPLATGDGLWVGEKR